MTKYNLGGWSFNIHIADGIYAYNTPMWLPLPNGSGAVQLIGNTANPGNVLLRNTGNGSAVIGDLGGIYYCVGLSFTASVQIPEDNGNCIWCLAGTVINVTNCSFGSCPGEHLNSQGGYINIYGPNTITGNAAAHWYTGLNGTIGVNAYPYPALTIANPVTISTFIIATTGGQAGAWWSAFNNAGFVSGAKYLANGNGVVDSNGRGTSFLPGTVAGSLATGGQYL
jgi:hypothetical protein